mmetsp:Transcript_13670/g.28240  ORF Transcript_13670/g.28240 Transcript_13670/m.28240 type:complete len:211 (-) Transcript_13670:119-751(-)
MLKGLSNSLGGRSLCRRAAEVVNNNGRKRHPQHWDMTRRCFAGNKWHSDYGFDILGDAVTNYQGDRPKVILEGYGPDGFEVSNIVKKIDRKDKNTTGTVFIRGSIVAFPFGVFQWNVKSVKELTVESLAPIILHYPKIEVLMIGCNRDIPWRILTPLMKEMQEQYGIPVEKAELFYTIGTFNILNGEDREIAVALIQDPKAFQGEEDSLL